MRKVEVRHIVLAILDPIKGALPEPTLHAFLNLRVRPLLEAAEFAETLTWLSSEDLIASMKNDLDPDMLHWFIKERGMVALRK